MRRSELRDVSISSLEFRNFRLSDNEMQYDITLDKYL